MLPAHPESWILPLSGDTWTPLSPWVSASGVYVPDPVEVGSQEVWALGLSAALPAFLAPF